MLLIVSGFSGVGKGTVINCLLETTDGIALVKPDKTRSKRNRDEYFTQISKEEFIRRINEGYYLEYNIYNGEYYGTPAGDLFGKMSEYPFVILEIDVNGARNVLLDPRIAGTDHRTVFLAAGASELASRLAGRGESSDSAAKRMRIAMEECRSLPQYDTVLINREVDETMHKLKQILCHVEVPSDSFDTDRFCKDAYVMEFCNENFSN